MDEKTGAIYVATGDSYSDPAAKTSDAIVALDLKTGAIKWSQQMTANDAYNIACGMPDPVNCPEAKGPDHDFGSPPILVALSSGKRALVVGQKSAFVHALDPDDNGRVLWSTRIGRGGPLGGVEWGSAADGEHIYVPLSDIGLKFTNNAMVPEGAVGGGMFALRLSDGRQIWHTPSPGCGERANCSPAQSAPPTLIRCGVLRIDRRASARLCTRRRPHRVGLRYHAGLSDGERREGARRIDRRRRTSHRRRHPVDDVRLPAMGWHARQRPARLFG